MNRNCPRPWPLLLGLFAMSFFLSPSSLLAHDWASWRGPEQNGVSREVDLPAKISLDPKDKNSNLLWRAPYHNRSTPIVMNGRVYFNNQVGKGVNERERVMCLDADTGKKIWEQTFTVWHTDIVSVRLGWGSLVGDPKTENVYWHGTQGEFICFNKDGKILWRRSLTEEFGRVSGYGGRITSPVIDEDLVMIGMNNFGWGSQARGATRVLAMNKYNGKVVWWWTSPKRPLGAMDSFYSYPLVAVIGGQRLLIMGGGDGWLHCMKARTGEHVWSYPITKGSINPSPVAMGNYVYICHGAENAENTNIKGGVFCLDASKVKDGQPKLVWRELGIECQYTSPILHDGKLYLCTDIARMYCLDAKTGRQRWRRPLAYGRNAKGSPVWADGKIYVAPVNGSFVIADPGARRGTVLSEVLFPSPDGIEAVETNGSPAVANGRIYFGTTEGIYCFGKKNHKGKAGAIPPMPKEAPPGKATTVRLYPEQITLYPGKHAQFQVQVLDTNGRVLKQPVNATWSLPAPPKPPLPPFLKKGPPQLRAMITKNGTLVVDAKVPQQIGLVEVKTELGTAQARVRVVPKLPYTENFDKTPKGYTPLSWVNCQGKFFVVTLKDGNHVLRNNNKVPSALVSKAEAFIGKPSWTNLTIQADVMGDKVDTDLPDMGVIANRYRLLLWGNKQVFRLDAWDAMPRVAVARDYEIKPNVWYRIKLRVQIVGNQAKIHGKVWQRNEPEPKEWQIDYTDPNPNTTGCPGLYRFGTGVQEGHPGCSVYFDNVVITPNKKS